jgi:hypothetical protein
MVNVNSIAGRAMIKSLGKTLKWLSVEMKKRGVIGDDFMKNSDGGIDEIKHWIEFEILRVNPDKVRLETLVARSVETPSKHLENKIKKAKFELARSDALKRTLGYNVEPGFTGDRTDDGEYLAPFRDGVLRKSTARDSSTPTTTSTRYFITRSPFDNYWIPGKAREFEDDERYGEFTNRFALNPTNEEFFKHPREIIKGIPHADPDIMDEFAEKYINPRTGKPRLFRPSMNDITLDIRTNKLSGRPFWMGSSMVLNTNTHDSVTSGNIGQIISNLRSGYVSEGNYSADFYTLIMVSQDKGKPREDPFATASFTGYRLISDGLSRNDYEGGDCAYQYLAEFGCNISVLKAKYNDRPLTGTEIVNELPDYKIIVIDAFKRIVYTRPGTNKKKVICFKIANNHIYPIDDPIIKRNLVHTVDEEYLVKDRMQTLDEEIIKKRKIKNAEDILEVTGPDNEISTIKLTPDHRFVTKTVTYYRQDSMDIEFSKITKKVLIQHPIRLSDGKVQRFSYEKTDYAMGDYIFDVLKPIIAKLYGRVYDNLGSFCKSLGGHMLLNKSTMDTLQEGRVAAYVKKYNSSKSTTGLDINKCRWNILTSNSFAVFGLDSKFIEWSPGTKLFVDDIHDGKYIVNVIRDSMCVKYGYQFPPWTSIGVNIISGHVLRRMMEVDVDFEVLYDMEPKKLIRFNHLDQIIDAVVDCDISPELQDSVGFSTINKDVVMKYLGCRLSGLLGKRAVVSDTGMMSSRDDCINCGNFDRIQIHPNGYLGIKSHKKKLFHTGFSIYQDILDIEALNVRILASFCPNVVAIKTDCVVFDGECNIPDAFISSKPGFVKFETSKSTNIDRRMIPFGDDGNGYDWKVGGINECTEEVVVTVECVDKKIYTRNGSGVSGVYVPDIEVSDMEFEGGIHCAKYLTDKCKPVSVELLYDEDGELMPDCPTSGIPNRGYYVTGVPGCGKSELITGSVLGDNEIKLCYTNSAARRIGGQTIHAGLGLMEFALHEYDVVKIDEIGMIPIEVWEELYYYKLRYNPIFLLCGDVEQCPPIGDKVDLDTIISLFCSVRYKLINNWRSKDTAEAYRLTLAGEYVPLETAFQDRAICMYNTTRQDHNARVMFNILKSGTPYTSHEYGGKNKSIAEYSQTCVLTVGTPVIPLITKKGSFYKNYEYVVSCLHPLTIQDDDGVEIVLESFDGFIVNWAITGFRSQGAGYKFKYMLLDFKYMPKCLKYVSISRCSTIKNVYYSPVPKR